MSLNNYSKRNRVLITGGAGFLGSHLTERLLAEGNEVICADSLFTGTKDNIAAFADNPYYEFIRHDICLLYTSPSPRDRQKSRMPSSA